MQLKAFGAYLGMAMKCSCERQRLPLSLGFKALVERVCRPSEPDTTSDPKLSEANVTLETRG